MTLHLVYRSYGGENMKRRPSFYSKALTLASFVRAASKVAQVEMVFLNDGPVPAARLEVMEAYGRVVQMGEHAQGMRQSYRAALELATDGPWPDDEVVCFVEDDYLFTDEAFVALAAAADGLSKASYFSLYGVRPDPSDPGDRDLHALPQGWVAAPDEVVDGLCWYNRASITSTFAARLGALRGDLDIFWLCMRPFRRSFFDHETCLLYQGVAPYRGRELWFGLPGDFVPGLRGVARATYLVPFRVALNRRARRQREAHLLYVVTPNLATHLEHPVISPDQDWRVVADKVTAWAAENNLAVASLLGGERAPEV